MRKRPIRGETYTLLTTGDNVQIIDTLKSEFVKVIIPNGKILAVTKSQLNLPWIDTKEFEKVDDAA